MSTSLFSLAFGVGTQNRQGAWLEVFYAQPLINPSAELIAAITPVLGYTGGNQAITFNTDLALKLADALKSVDAVQAALLSRLAESHKPLVATLLAEDAALTSTPEAYLKLHLLSHRLVKPHGLNLAGIFPLLPNVAWTSQGAIDLAELAPRQLEARLKGELLEVFSVDKFPKMTDYVVPSGVRDAVFVAEQSVPPELEWDAEDSDAIHFLALEGDYAIGTARLLPDGEIGRLSVPTRQPVT